MSSEEILEIVQLCKKYVCPALRPALNRLLSPLTGIGVKCPFCNPATHEIPLEVWKAILNVYGKAAEPVPRRHEEN